MNLVEICKETGIKSKHLRKAEIFYQEIAPYFSGKRIVDICSGNGLLGWYFLLQMPSIQVLSIDIKQTRKNKYLKERILRVYSGITDRFHCLNADINNTQLKLENSDFIVSMHACGHLSDRVIEIALENHLPFSIVPCCYEPDRHVLKPANYSLPQGISREEIVDHLRVRYIEEKGRECICKTIKDFPSPKNRLIVSPI